MVSLEKVETNYFDNEYCSDKSYMRANMYNDTTTIIEGLFDILKDTPASETKMVRDKKINFCEKCFLSSYLIYNSYNSYNVL